MPLYLVNPTLLSRKANLTPRQYKAQMLLSKFSNLQIIHTTGTNLTVADMLSRDLQPLIIKHVNYNIKAFLHTLIFFNFIMITF